ncbi:MULTISPECIES: hypothetical protein [unclassified Aeromonas]|uniref:hypothetical protein n=1 Tax=unclassified Aeromonas TaxID=257493 RepID=UPI00084B1458|nr:MULTISPECIES: hypothetical protein [unclassified Aeromonas]OEC48006.1 hypothetical protein A9G04_21445 [Aeromonas sp. ANNP30]OEC60399.1 hypothetical protein A9G49_21430 [Aeromonas sp. ANP5]
MILNHATTYQWPEHRGDINSQNSRHDNSQSTLLLRNLDIWLAKLKHDGFLQEPLKSSDDVQHIFNKIEKDDALEILSKEVSDLAASVYQGLYPYSREKDINKLA